MLRVRSGQRQSYRKSPKTRSMSRRIIINGSVTSWRRVARARFLFHGIKSVIAILSFPPFFCCLRFHFLRQWAGPNVQMNLKSMSVMRDKEIADELALSILPPALEVARR